MTNYLFIESRDPFESRDTRFVEQTTTALLQRGNEVTIFLLQNGVLAARKNARDATLRRMAEAGVKVLADDFSLLERGIQTGELAPGIQPSNIETLVDALVQENTKAIWH
jgi:sulfur relay (sulfurtransferase) complex TusBCD TusD component (DsrE family)